MQNIKDQAKTEGFPLILDEGVTVNLKGLLRLPFSIHGDTKKVVVPFDPAKVAEFKVSEVPTLHVAVSNANLIDKYCLVLKEIFFKSLMNSCSVTGKTVVYKSSQRNPAVNPNTIVEDSEFMDIWELIKVDINLIK